MVVMSEAAGKKDNYSRLFTAQYYNCFAPLPLRPGHYRKVCQVAALASDAAGTPHSMSVRVSERERERELSSANV
jgi:hypothetical protein